MMRGVIWVLLFGSLAIVLYAESEPILGSGSGDGDDEDVVLIAPTNGTKTTAGYGSGLPDDEDYGSGSAIPSTTETFTTSAPTTVRESTTTEEETTTETATSSTATIITDDEDVYSGSGSGSGRVSTRPQDETTTTSTDIYITEQSTTDNTLIIQAREQVTTTESTVQEITTPKPRVQFKPTAAPTSESWISKSTAEWIEATTQELLKTDAATTEQSVVESVNTDDKFREEISEEPKVVNDLLPGTTPRRNNEKTTPSQSGNIMALKNNKKEPGFTLTTEVIAGVVGCALLALLLIAFLMYRLKKRDEGSYLLDDSNGYPVDYKKMHASDKEAFI